MLDRLGTARWLLVSHSETGQQPAACAPALPATSKRPGISRSFFSLAAPHAPQPRSVYYVASPEACAAILWKSREKAGTVRRPGMLRQGPPVLCALISKGCITAERAQLRVNTLCLVPACSAPPGQHPAASGDPPPGLAPARCLPPFCGAPTMSPHLRRPLGLQAFPGDVLNVHDISSVCPLPFPARRPPRRCASPRQTLSSSRSWMRSSRSRWAPRTPTPWPPSRPSRMPSCATTAGVWA